MEQIEMIKPIIVMIAAFGATGSGCISPASPSQLEDTRYVNIGGSQNEAIGSEVSVDGFAFFDQGIIIIVNSENDYDLGKDGIVAANPFFSTAPGSDYDPPEGCKGKRLSVSGIVGKVTYFDRYGISEVTKIVRKSDGKICFRK